MRTEFNHGRFQIHRVSVLLSRVSVAVTIIMFANVSWIYDIICVHDNGPLDNDNFRRESVEFDLIRLDFTFMNERKKNVHMVKMFKPVRKFGKWIAVQIDLGL